jgi:hypothetical protein
MTTKGNELMHIYRKNLYVKATQMSNVTHGPLVKNCNIGHISLMVSDRVVIFIGVFLLRGPFYWDLNF